MLETSLIKWNEQGLIPAIVQDVATGQVLMLAWMNVEALRLTRETGQMHFWSRSRQTIWHKGSTSGNFQTVEALSLDCDQDAILAQVRPHGPACHTGRMTCFFQQLQFDDKEQF